MDARQRERWGLAAALVLAAAVALDIATGEWLWAGLVGALGTLLVVARLSGARFASSCLLVLWCGYWLGNRGFAQLSPSSGIPLFPAELALLVLFGAAVWRLAKQQRWPWVWDPTATALTLWIGIGFARFVPSFAVHKIEAIRDFATVYYAGFFFLALMADREAPLAGQFDRALRWCSAGLIPLFFLFRLFPEFFTETLVVRGNPLLYYKDDLAGTFLAMGAVAHYLYFRRTSRGVGLFFALACTASVGATHNRASMLGLAMAVLVLGLRGRLGLLAWLGGACAAAALGLGVAVATGTVKWENTPGPAVLDLAASVVDVEGTSRYRAAETEFKGDNNRFRTVWWTTVLKETVDANPWVGLGFGHDLAARFLDVYYPDSSEDFTARSPHSIWVTLFARTGALGLAAFVAVALAAGIAVWRTLTLFGAGAEAVPALAVVVILTSASLGVVLEGPMGAVVFWSALGLTRSALRRAPGPKSGENPEQILDKSPPPN